MKSHIFHDFRTSTPFKGGGGGGGAGGSVRIEPWRQLLEDCTYKRNSKRKVGNLYITEIVFSSSAFQKSTFQKHRMKLKKFGHQKTTF